jgi:hypothetical protein
LGWLDFERLWVNPTYLGSGILGGLLFGVGFVVGGYCPGTACVGVATGRIDALVLFVGIFAGIFGFNELYPLVSGFYNSTDMGQLTLPQVTGLPYGLLVFAVVLLALGGFAGAEWVEKRMAARNAGS